MAKAKSYPLVNIERVELVTEGTTPTTVSFDTATEASYSPVLSEGDETILRTKNTIHAINRTEDIQYGSDIEFTDAKFVPDVLALVDGGTITKEENGEITGYSSPPTGAVVNRTPFTLNIYTAEKDIDGNIVKYFKFTFPHSKGSPAEFDFQDGEFLSPTYTIHSRAAAGESPVQVSVVTELPDET
ncbi:hypothetical protein [Clostridium kluyveri]|uniref:hypothetical protein n=1 Tax=Clostridium kluyveri TaxID=1534 RepID=UPI002246D976|nr:hypothetical protein [Clostridium kluyveri]UZQ49112.1 hypothetical protein OP486_14235 [Clostridium kluyveri]